MRNFNQWFSTFIKNIYTYKYYIDFQTVYNNAKEYECEFNLLNTLVGKKNQEEEFKSLINKYPDVLKCIPSLLAMREMEISATDDKGYICYDFNKPNVSINQYCYFMRETGLFELLSSHLINSVPDYIIGIETGMNTNARKNRGGDLMEDLVEKYIRSLGFTKDVDYFKEMRTDDCERRFGIDFSSMTNNNKAVKRFDFVVKHHGVVFGIETNCYGSSGSKLNEVARSYKELFSESQMVNGFEFIWITDGEGWIAARPNLQETFDAFDNVYNIHDMKSGFLDKHLLGK
jgi:type II restriction enzyme